MYIVSKGKDAFINMNSVTEIYMKESDSIRADLSNGNNIPIAKYGSEQEGIVAIKMLADYANIRSDGVFYMPSDNEVKTYKMYPKEQWHHAEGKKTKGHGGS